MPFFLVNISVFILLILFLFFLHIRARWFYWVRNTPRVCEETTNCSWSWKKNACVRTALGVVCNPSTQAAYNGNRLSVRCATISKYWGHTGKIEVKKSTMLRPQS